MAIQNVFLSNTPEDSHGEITLSEDLLTASFSAINENIRVNLSRYSGKFYWEVTKVTDSRAFIGIISDSMQDIVSFSSNSDIARLFDATTTIIKTGDTVGVALDLDNGTMEFYKNGNPLSSTYNYSDINAFTSDGVVGVRPLIRSGVSSTILKTNFGGEPFQYPVPIGYVAYAEQPVYYCLIGNHEVYKKYDLITNTWRTLATTSPTELDYLQGNTLEEITGIPESAWQELQGDITLAYYTDDLLVESFTVETETEPFTIYDEFGDTVEVLYYNDDKTKTSADLEVTANYTPLDEIEGDFDVVTWTDAMEDNLQLGLTAVPQPQITVYEMGADVLVTLQGLLISYLQGHPQNTVRVALSSNKVIWKVYGRDGWQAITEGDLPRKGMTPEDIEELSEEVLGELGEGKIYLRVYIDQSILASESPKVRNVQVTQGIPRTAPKLTSTSYKIVNTIPTLDLTFKGNILGGSAEDGDLGKIRYKVTLNGNPYFPSEGEYTEFQTAPVSVNVQFLSGDIKVGQMNTIRVDVEDYFGNKDYWEQEVEGKYVGLLFSDPEGGFYTSDIGEILQYLEIGAIEQGQTTMDYEVRLTNTNPFDVENTRLVGAVNTAGINLQLSKYNSPFTEETHLTWDEVLGYEEMVVFYVRLHASASAETTANGIFQVTVEADPVE